MLKSLTIIPVAGQTDTSLLKKKKKKDTKMILTHSILQPCNLPEHELNNKDIALYS